MWFLTAPGSQTHVQVQGDAADKRPCIDRLIGGGMGAGHEWPKT
jgi:hypothetical protein